MKHDSETTPLDYGKIIYWVLFAGAFLWLFNALAIAFQSNWGKPLNEDIPEFIEGALNSTFFYDSGLREPFHVGCLKVALWFVPDHERAARLTTVVQTFLAGFAIWFYAKEIFHKGIALVSLWLFVVNPIVIYYGVSGLRASIYMALLLLFSGMLWRLIVKQAPPLSDIIVTGVVAGALVLTRRYAAAIIIAGLLVGGGIVWRYEKERTIRYLKAAAGVLGVASLLFLPDLLFHETPAFKDNVNFFRNLELYGSAGAFRESPPVSFFQYVFLDHTLTEVLTIIIQNIAGFPKLYLGHFYRALPLFWILAWIATGLIFFSPRFAWGSLLAWASLAPIVFVLHLDQVSSGSGVENRLVIQTFALFLPGMVATLFFFGQRLCLLFLREGEVPPDTSQPWYRRLDRTFWFGI